MKVLGRGLWISGKLLVGLYQGYPQSYPQGMGTKLCVMMI
ncbi:hypothetical protein HMPREF0645_0314 [Hallella bergensis DSM 17361]|uniref:Uncharacterized protein n=1 Tax=Hallella bergensis DSM 17361 TaxID=585502 RepID=D1PTM9_9BACT|nr:hypothetical protein HMPREF0645_0314 [Hallella bergensis DSM 17361]